MLRFVAGIGVSISTGLLLVSGLAGQQYNPFQGSVPSGKSASPLALTLQDAIRRGLQYNLGFLENERASETARAQRIQALSALLPQVTGNISATETQINLKTVGFGLQPNPSLPLPTIVGPFSYTTAEAKLSMKVMDWSAIRNLRSARANEEAATLSVQAARDLVVQAVANAYLGIIADASRVEAIKAQVDTDDALYKRATDQRNAGLAAGINVLRAQVALKTEQQVLLAQQNQLDKDKLAMGRIIGLPAEQVFHLADTVPFSPLTGITEGQAFQTALAQRPDYQSAKKMVEAAQQALAAARAEWYPTIDLNGYYGGTGPPPFNWHGVFQVTGALNFNIFTGGRIRADTEEARSALQQRSEEQANLGEQIDVDVRNAFLDLQSAEEQVKVARDNLGLADQTLDQARDRFTAGVADNVEVVQAQGSVALANDNLIGALYAHNLAKVALARAMGMADVSIGRFLEVK